MEFLLSFLSKAVQRRLENVAKGAVNSGDTRAPGADDPSGPPCRAHHAHDHAVGRLLFVLV